MLVCTRQKIHVIYCMDADTEQWDGCWPGNNRHPVLDFMCRQEAAAAKGAF